MIPKSNKLNTRKRLSFLLLQFRGDVGTEKDAFGEAASMHFAEEVDELIRLEGGAAKIAPGAEGQ